MAVIESFCSVLPLLSSDQYLGTTGEYMNTEIISKWTVC